MMVARGEQKDIVTYFDWNENPKLGLQTSVSKVLGYGNEYKDTIEIYTSNPRLFSVDNYVFNSADEIVKAFPKADVRIATDFNSPPIFTTVISEYGDSLDFICEWWNLSYSLYEGHLQTNSLIEISKNFKIGVLQEDITNFMMIDRLKINLPNSPSESCMNYRTIIIKRCDLPKEFVSISNCEFSDIIVNLVSGQVVSIDFKS